MNPTDYLQRINYTGGTAPTLENLHRLQRAHLMTVPFENLDIHAKRPIILDRSQIFRKIVDNRRGGFCYELNGLFGWLLEQLGFEVALLRARVVNKEGQLGHPFDHLTLKVRANGQEWLVDVGFGHFYEHPIQLVFNQPLTYGQQQYEIEPQPPYWMLKFREDGGEWRPHFAFTQTPQTFAAFEGGCHFHQTSPDSHFTQGRIISLPLPNGRKTLTDELFIVTQNGEREETAVENKAHFRQLLKTHFDIVLSK